MVKISLSLYMSYFYNSEVYVFEIKLFRLPERPNTFQSLF